MAGVILIGIGVIGLFLPIVQGVLLIIAGLFLMGIKIEDVKKWFNSLKSPRKLCMYTQYNINHDIEIL